jgi:hypothetical protein
MSMDSIDLERRVDSRLRRLPQPRAPHTLLPRIIAAVRAAARPWYQREWLSWPAAWQTLSAVLLVSLVIGLGLWLPAVQTTVDARVNEVLAPVTTPVVDAVARVQALATAARVFWRAAQPAAGLLLVVVLIMCAACAVFGAALNRVAFGGALRS